MESTPEPVRAIALYGTDEPIDALTLLKAGPLTAEFDGGNLRHLRVGGIEVIRAISYIVRDENWGTLRPVISDLEVDQDAASFEVSYNASVERDGRTLKFQARISGTSETVRFEAVGASETGFLTNRTGFVVLHPIVGVAGRAVTIERVDGTIEQGSFPETIDPVQPMMDVRALTHEPEPGLHIACRFEGDTFEMEDQRNWTDASFKTYVRPLALPWPYELPAGEKFEQAVIVSGRGENSGAAPADDLVRFEWGNAPAKVQPEVGVGIASEELEPTLNLAPTFKLLAPQHLVLHFDPRKGDDADTLRRAADVAVAMGCGLWLEAVVVDVADFARELETLGEWVQALPVPVPVVLVSPASDMRGTLPGSKWPPAPPPTDLYAAARRAFPNSRLGGGMFSFFTELNRKRPPVDLIDLVSFTTSGAVHAGDDRTVMENLESLPFIASSARAIAGRRPFAVGPSAIGMRMNPYGDAPVANPDNLRQAMNHNDPRQRGLFGAAWMVGFYAGLARGGADSISFGGTTGPFGLLYAKAEYPQPWFDAHRGLFPMFHVLRVLARFAGRPRIQVGVTGDGIETAGANLDGQRELLIANLTADVRSVALPSAPKSIRLLNVENFATAADDPLYFDREDAETGAEVLRLDAYAVARVIYPN